MKDLGAAGGCVSASAVGVAAHQEPDKGTQERESEHCEDPERLEAAAVFGGAENRKDRYHGKGQIGQGEKKSDQASEKCEYLHVPSVSRSSKGS